MGNDVVAVLSADVVGLCLIWGATAFGLLCLLCACWVWWLSPTIPMDEDEEGY